MTTKTKPTPGEWSASTSLVRGDDRKVIAMAETNGDARKIVNAHNDSIKEMLEQRNALLNALEEIELLAKEIKRNHCANIIAAKCDDVIAKAKGETPA